MVVTTTKTTKPKTDRRKKVSFSDVDENIDDHLPPRRRRRRRRKPLNEEGEEDGLWYSKKELRNLRGENGQIACMHAHSYRPKGGFNWISDHNNSDDMIFEEKKVHTYRGLERFSKSRQMLRHEYCRNRLALMEPPRRRKSNGDDRSRAEISVLVETAEKCSRDEAICIGLKDAYLALRVHQELQSLPTVDGEKNINWGIELDESLRGYVERPMVGRGTISRSARHKLADLGVGKNHHTTSSNKSSSSSSRIEKRPVRTLPCRLDSFSSRVNGTVPA